MYFEYMQSRTHGEREEAYLGSVSVPSSIITLYAGLILKIIAARVALKPVWTLKPMDVNRTYIH